MTQSQSQWLALEENILWDIGSGGRFHEWNYRPDVTDSRHLWIETGSPASQPGSHRSWSG